MTAPKTKLERWEHQLKQIFDEIDSELEAEGACKIFSSSKLQTSLQGSPNPGDVLTWQGHKWELVKEGAFDNGLIPHYTYVAECRGPV